MNLTMRRCVSVQLVLIFVCLVQCASSVRNTSDCPTPGGLKNGRIRARGRGRIIRYSCFSGYELVGNKYSTCIRGSWDTPTPICVSTRCSAAPVPQHAVVGEKYHGAILMYFCEPGYVLVGNAEIYCDGRQWNGTTPYCRDSNAIAPTSCDFEKEGLCWWEQDPKHDFDWIKHRFDTPSAHIGTGPTHDHTLGAGNDGYYLYIEATGRLANDTARILSPLYNANLTDSGCFSFWYHMYGATIGTLNVYFKPETEKTPKLVWSKNGNQGNQWHRGLFDLPTVNNSFQLIIEGVRGTSYVSDIAIDDLAILQGDECVVKTAILNNTTPAPDGDEVEVFNAMQSCRDRCVNTLTETTPSSELYTSPDACQCTLDCADTSSCCPDYSEYCIYEITDQPEIMLPTSVVSLTKSTTVSSSVTPSTEKQSKNASTIAATTITTSPYSVTTKSERTTVSTVASTTTATTRVITEVTTKIETTAETKVTSKKQTWAPTVLPSTTTMNVETPFVPLMPETTAYSIDDAPMRTEAHLLIEDARQLKKSTALNLSGTIGIVIGILTGFAMIAFVAFVIYRRRKFYTRSSDGSAYSEDCTVGFLTSVETLDFSLARPSDDDEKC
ncbi:uncharacterized protein LOC106646576 [Copidosoma floridanum]|uniref:uncharacterized protein LOC106646576 n=1 Tax=Copidosoma floridanum TaxID=29053 RepID=UPI0006C94F49|nr:uncharacterized protein LOC106646576 [Copidosoma floridanum]